MALWKGSDHAILEWALSFFLWIYRILTYWEWRRVHVLSSWFTFRCQDVLEMTWKAFLVQALEWLGMLAFLVLLMMAVRDCEWGCVFCVRRIKWTSRIGGRDPASLGKGHGRDPCPGDVFAHLCWLELLHLGFSGFPSSTTISLWFHSCTPLTLGSVLSSLSVFPHTLFQSVSYLLRATFSDFISTGLLRCGGSFLHLKDTKLTLAQITRIQRLVVRSLQSGCLRADLVLASLPSACVTPKSLLSSLMTMIPLASFAELDPPLTFLPIWFQSVFPDYRLCDTPCLYSAPFAHGADIH